MEEEEEEKQLYLAVVHFIFSRLININTYLPSFRLRQIEDVSAENPSREHFPIHNTKTSSFA